MVITDRYLDDRERIVSRLGAHIELAQQNGTLEWVVVHTLRKERAQEDAIRQLKARFPHLRIKFDLDSRVAHDRVVEVTRVNGCKARVLIGMGLDFIDASGSLRKTFLVFQNSYTN